MNPKKLFWFAATISIVLLMGFALNVGAQVGKSQGLVDANTASEKDLLTFPSMTPAIAPLLLPIA